MLEEIKTNPESMELTKSVHGIITSSNRDIHFRVFPIYIKYYIDFNPVFILYFKGKYVAKGELDFGIKSETMPNIEGFRDAGYMKDSNINFSILIKGSNFSEKLIKQILEYTSIKRS